MADAEKPEEKLHDLYKREAGREGGVYRVYRVYKVHIRAWLGK